MVSVLPQLLVGLVSFMMLTEPSAAAPRGGFFGAFLGENDEEDKPKPPVPPMGQMIRPMVVSRPMPRPIAPPAIPTFVDEKPSPLQAESRTADNPVPAETEMAEATTDLDLSLNVAKVSAKPAPIESACSDSSDDAELDSDEADLTLDEALANLDASEDEMTFNAPTNDEEMTSEAAVDHLAAELYDELPPLEQEPRDDGGASIEADMDADMDAEQEDEAEIASLELTEPSLDEQSLADQVPHRSATDAKL
ncbi:secreted protein, partial [Rhodopirellula sallentina SM41]